MTREGFESRSFSRRGLIRLASAVAIAGAAIVPMVTAELAAAQDKIMAISFPNYSKQTPVLIMMDHIERMGGELGYKLVLDDPVTDLNRQINTINTWIEQKVDVIVAVVLEPQAFESVAAKARNAGIKWITYAGKIENQDATVGFDHYGSGFMLGEFAGEWMAGKPDIEHEIVVLGFEKGAWGQERGRGIREGVLSKVPDANFVATQDALSPTEGLNATRSILQGNPNANVFLGIVDPGTEGAYKAWIATGRDKGDPNAFFGGLDGSPEALKNLRDGGTAYRVSFAIPLLDIAEGVVDTAELLLAGGTVDGDVLVAMQKVVEGSPLAAKFLADQGATD